MDKTELRKKDFITSLILIAFGIFMILYTLTKVPMKDSYGGVMNVWFVSPGLFPLGIGIFIIILAIVLCNRAIKDGGAKNVLSRPVPPGEGFIREDLALLWNSPCHFCLCILVYTKNRLLLKHPAVFGSVHLLFLFG